MDVTPRVIEEHVSVRAAKDVADICKPLLETFGLSGFEYIKHYRDKSVCYLASRSDIFLNFFRKNYHKTVNVMQPPGNHLVASCFRGSTEQQYLDELRQQFNYYYPYAIVTDNGNYLERITFSVASDDSSILGLYLNGKEVFEKFLIYFKERAANLIEFADKERYIYNPSVYVNSKLYLDFNKSYKDFLEKIKTKKVFINYKNKDIAISRREYECIYYISQGKTMKEVARILNISNRTVEVHICHAKDKIGCYKKSQLADALHV